MKTLYILDAYSLFYTSYFAGAYADLSSNSGEPTYGTFIFIRTLLKLLEQYNPDLLCVAVDGPAKTFRKKLYKEYKSNRKGEMPEGLLPQINRMKQILECMNFPVYYAPGYEADDVIGTIVEKADPELVITIVSKDKDLLQLLTKDKNADVLDPYKNKRMFNEDVFEKYEIRPDQFIDYLALVGDTSDNIPGVKGIGPKTAVKILRQYNSIEELYEALYLVFEECVYEDILNEEIGKKNIEKLKAGKENCLLSKKLATIRKDVPMDIDFEDMKRREFAWDKLNPVFEELGFESLVQGKNEKFGNRELP